MASFVEQLSQTDTNHRKASALIVRPKSQAENTAESTEWEYEYSNTETDTYYLTLDLTTPTIPAVRRATPTINRGGGYAVRWINHGLRGAQKAHRRANTMIANRPGPGATSGISKPTHSAPTPVPDLVQEEEEEEEEQDEEDEEAEPDEDIEMEDNTNQNLPQNEGLEDRISEVTDVIQVLDLHSHNPIVRYRDHHFSCKWAENLGTELLFTAHESTSQSPLPTLRSLPNNVDLLAASSARLLGVPVKLVPKESSTSAPTPVKENEANKLGAVTFNVGPGASEARKNQAGFLQRLVNIKQQKGEKDAVSTIVQKRQTTNVWYAQVKSKRERQRVELRALAAKGGRSRLDARAKLEKMDKEDAEMDLKSMAKKAKETKTKLKGKRRKAKHVERGVHGPRNVIRRPNASTHSYLIDDSVSGVQLESLSVPTPRSWSELEGRQSESSPGRDEQEPNSGEDFDDDIDRDGEGEYESTPMDL